MEKADEELIAIGGLRRVSAADWIIGFHCQQVAEKALKAVLVGTNRSPEKTHDMVYLIREIEASGVDTPEWFWQLEGLNPYSVQFRYENLDAIANFTAEYAEDLARRAFDWARLELGWNDEELIDIERVPNTPPESRLSGDMSPPIHEADQDEELPF